MNIAAKEAKRKAEHPEQYCPFHRCLWRVVKLNHETQQYEKDPKYPDGRCPRHPKGA